MLVGHSLGGRAALLAVGHPAVVGAVALNPWLHPSDSADLAGRRVLVVHGEEDQVAPLGRVQAVLPRLRGAAGLELRTVPGAGHAMLRHGGVFERAASDFVVHTLLGARAGS